MESEQAISSERGRCIFYFKYQMKFEFIPYVEQQIGEFLQVCHSRVHLPQQRPRIMIVITRRLAQIDNFYLKNWNDYRIQQILRSRKLLIDFTKQYHHLLTTEEPEEPARELEPSPSRQDFNVFQEKDRSVSRGSHDQIDRRHEQSDRRHEQLDRRHEQLDRSHSRNQQQNRSNSKHERPDRSHHPPSPHRTGSKNSSDQQFSSYREPVGHQMTNPHQMNTPQPRKVPSKQSPGTGHSKQKRRVSSTESGHVKAKGGSGKALGKSPSPVVKSPPPVRKMTKEEYIAHLRGKKGKT